AFRRKPLPGVEPASRHPVGPRGSFRDRTPCHPGTAGRRLATPPGAALPDRDRTAFRSDFGSTLGGTDARAEEPVAPGNPLQPGGTGPPKGTRTAISLALIPAMPMARTPILYHGLAGETSSLRRILRRPPARPIYAHPCGSPPG